MPTIIPYCFYTSRTYSPNITLVSKLCAKLSDRRFAPDANGLTYPWPEFTRNVLRRFWDALDTLKECKHLQNVFLLNATLTFVHNLCSQRQNGLTILMKYCRQKHCQKIFDTVMFIRTLPTTLLLIFNATMFNSGVIVKSIINPDDNFWTNF